jgi:thioredoxin reductase (NADPH)
MAITLSSHLENRRDQLFPILSAREIERLRRFGSEHTYGAGTALLSAGAPTPGLQIVLSGTSRVLPHEQNLRDQQIVEHSPGSLVVELSGLSGSS